MKYICITKVHKGRVYMEKDKFNNLSLIEQVKYINSLLEENKTLTNIAKDIGIGRSTIRDRFKKINYRYSKDSNKYIKDINVSNTGVIQGSADVMKNRQKELNTIDRADLKKYNVSNTSIDNFNSNIKDKLVNITNEYEVLMEMIELYKSNTNVLQSQICIDLPICDSELTSFRVNKKVLNDFNEFVKHNKEFRKIDLVSMALKEYMENHK